ncbi:ATP-binding cassette domain-containing protein [Paenibacillus polymyxa]|uniref:ATP-binding cassette domain-containing protein n=1 Tax=Paenibacillus polymyxa TaxID=1406 RepID=UPI0005CEA614|nr:ATP-binding cassette domain-containing protein [Paenibacillus polymyxa]KAE8558781.1 phosphate ABC transporter ATP-binding protein [Paenibacillus polymyxa]KJD39320.1 phosphate ABC transporter ATP-binding protein [Paenibacillus polymyxa]MCJ1219914.1 ATP-binding cassette domain-containing protein [Paenibacillus polymyxa]MDU8673591.1 ATP-binding cassette domain-containing protein [Paenibacillus polymyxa]MDU8698497.1 ATP-binding cassette domain-containing protein [Paenibacillus polymyxa]
MKPQPLSAIEFNHVTKYFTGSGQQRAVLNGITAKVPRGKITTLVGPSGSGKSTLLSLCNLLLTSDEGEVSVLGKLITEWEIPDLRRKVALVFQDAPMLQGTVLYNLQTVERLHGTVLEDPVGLLERVGLTRDLLEQKAQELSGGQRQRLALARTLANRPDILLLDEITSALDPASVKEVEELLLQMNKEEGTTMIWITHHMEQARRVGHETWLMINGRLVEQADTETFFNNPQHSETRKFVAGEWV